MYPEKRSIRIRDLLALSSDYDKTDKATQMFFVETQNKLLYAVTHQTAAEIIVSRADANNLTMSMISALAAYCFFDKKP